MQTSGSRLVHGTCVALGGRAALLRGASGAGKSDLALRFLALPDQAGFAARLVADDQVELSAAGSGTLIASPPKALAGKIEVRGLGIIDLPYISEAMLRLLVDLVEPAQIPRMPPERPDTEVIAGVPLPVMPLAPFESSAPIKLRLALLSFAD